MMSKNKALFWTVGELREALSGYEPGDTLRVIELSADGDTEDILDDFAFLIGGDVLSRESDEPSA